VLVKFVGSARHGIMSLSGPVAVVTARLIKPALINASSIASRRGGSTPANREISASDSCVPATSMNTFLTR
jgi:hypothetical protein